MKIKVDYSQLETLKDVVTFAEEVYLVSADGLKSGLRDLPGAKEVRNTMFEHYGFSELAADMKEAFKKKLKSKKKKYTLKLSILQGVIINRVFSSMKNWKNPLDYANMTGIAEQIDKQLLV